MGIRAQGNPLASFLDVWSNTGLDAVTAAPAAAGEGLTATGGIISDYTDGPAVYRAHIFISSGTFDVTAPGDFGDTVEYLVVSGGGGGGSRAGGGGGAGGLLVSPGDFGIPTSQNQGATVPIPASFPAPFTVTIGAGGVGALAPVSTSDGNDGTDGGPSAFGPVSTTGGGGGVGCNQG